MANQVLSTTFAGLGTAASVTASTSDIYNITGTLTIPTLITTGIKSQVVVTVNQNGSPVFTSAQGVQGFQTGVQATAGDVITIVISSSLPADAAPQAVKTTLSISEGL